MKEGYKLVEELCKERALFIQFEEIENERNVETMANIERKGNAVIELLEAYGVRPVA